MKKRLQEGVRFGNKEKSFIEKYFNEFQIGIEFEYHPDEFDEKFVAGSTAVTYNGSSDSEIYDAVVDGNLEEISSAVYDDYAVGYSPTADVMLLYRDYGQEVTVVVKRGNNFISYDDLMELYQHEDSSIAIEFFDFLIKFQRIIKSYNNNQYTEEETIDLVSGVYTELIDSGVELSDEHFLDDFGLVYNVSQVTYHDLINRLEDTNLDTIDDITEFHDSYQGSVLESLLDDINDPEDIIERIINDMDFVAAIQNHIEHLNDDLTVYAIDSDSNGGYENEFPSSIMGNIREVEIEHDYQYEVITNDLSIEDGLETIETMFDYISDNGHTSNKSGMHVSISTRSGRDEVDLLKYLVLSDLEYVVGYLDGKKVENHDPLFPPRGHVANIMDNLVFYMDDIISSDVREYILSKAGNVDMSGIINIVTKYILKSQVFDEKFQSIKFGDYDTSNGRIELRYFGGADYETKYDEIEDHIYKALYILYVSREGTLQKQYTRQLYKIVDNVLEKHSIGGSLLLIKDIKSRIDKGNFNDMETISKFIKRSRVAHDYSLVVETIEEYLAKNNK